ncbi:MAG: transcriptional repressor [Gammaproteobacteria bacterium]|nr:transcriptional repressor [Gammaproteobacteria bacterium]
MDKSNVISPFHGDHDHSHCQAQAIESAIEECNRKGLRLTKLRQQVLEIIWTSHCPIGAYDVLQKLQEAGHKPAPPTAYRALDFLVSASLIHRIESLNAYIGCPSPGGQHQCQFYICSECHTVAETNNVNVSEALQTAADEIGFHSTAPVIEIHGVCKDCQNTSD